MAYNIITLTDEELFKKIAYLYIYIYNVDFSDYVSWHEFILSIDTILSILRVIVTKM